MSANKAMVYAGSKEASGYVATLETVTQLQMGIPALLVEIGTDFTRLAKEFGDTYRMYTADEAKALTETVYTRIINLLEATSILQVSRSTNLLEGKSPLKVASRGFFAGKETLDNLFATIVGSSPSAYDPLIGYTAGAYSGSVAVTLHSLLHALAVGILPWAMNGSGTLNYYNKISPSEGCLKHVGVSIPAAVTTHCTNMSTTTEYMYLDKLYTAVFTQKGEGTAFNVKVTHEGEVVFNKNADVETLLSDTINFVHQHGEALVSLDSPETELKEEAPPSGYNTDVLNKISDLLDNAD